MNNDLLAWPQQRPFVALLNNCRICGSRRNKCGGSIVAFTCQHISRLEFKSCNASEFAKITHRC